ncbi:hypothetical protein RN001_011675 [Aquatica leii]|uniref:Sphingomyelin phosphodiesterase 4 n=1 Tax=Aquatica leii TaxID=1421715 RepID=A0AAN7QE14_9COLE|nr:hypothetical protein RN001_011675 [Aquatica leii]
MLGRQPENFLTCFTQALNRPIQTRCAELAVLFDRGSLKDLHSMFPTLIDNIFGPHSSMCWDLRNITNLEHHKEFDVLQHFLSPQGPLFKVIYTLLRDPMLKFNYSLNFLPSKVRASVDGSTVHPFYMDLIQVDLRTNQTMTLMLNPFDYYFFHFAYHLINPFHQHYQSLTGTPWTTVYYILCCDYALYFLPTNPGNTILPVLSFYNGKNPIYMLPSVNKPAKVSRLIRANFLNQSSTQCLDHHPRNEIWRSETIMTVFIDMWLSNDQVLNSTINFDKGFGITQMPYKQNLKLNDVPTGEYIRIIRVLVKQLHAFASSSKADDSHMGDLKRIVIPYLQGRMYVFLRHLIHTWPLDGSFRLVLELWLSFLQPWRYPGNNYLKLVNQSEVNPDIDDISTMPMKAVEREHMPFMTDNLLAYTVLLQQLLPRFNRVDLSSPKIALILYRLTKVFGQPNLVTYLRAIEFSVQQLDTTPLHSYNINTNSLPPLSPTSNWSTNLLSKEKPNRVDLQDWDQSLHPQDSTFASSTTSWGNVVKQKILEYEGPNFCYKPMFIVPPASEVYELIRHIQKAQEVALSTIELRLKEIKEQMKGFFGFFKSIFGVSETTQDEFTLEERNKVPIYLEHSLKWLMEIFQITEDSIKERQSIESFSSTISSKSSTSQNDIGGLLTPQRVRERIKKIKYEGDPDLQPIQSFEVRVLVRLLYQLSSKINNDFGNQIRNLYYSNTFLGRLSRQVLCPPLTIHKFEKSPGSYSPRVSQELPPRLSFRYFGNFRVIFYLVLLALFSRFACHSYFTLFFVVFTMWFFYICLKALCDNEPSNSNAACELRMDVDVSINESF